MTKDRLEKLVKRHDSLEQEVVSLQAQQHGVKLSIIERLIYDGLPDMFSINWRKVRRLLAEQAKGREPHAKETIIDPRMR